MAILSATYQEACDYADELKRTYAQWFQIKYREKQILKKTDIQTLYLDNDWYVRNALAYIPHNALDNGCPIDQYRWSGYQAMFRKKDLSLKGLSVCSFSRREQDRIMHTRESLKDVPWLVDAYGDLWRTHKTTVNQLSRVFSLEREEVANAIKTHRIGG